jgi:hypothetical protein
MNDAPAEAAHAFYFVIFSLGSLAALSAWAIL